MSNAKSKTKELVRTTLSVDVLERNPYNPNEMDPEEFNMLCDNMETVGFTDPILVTPIPGEEGRYLIIGGEHRWEAAKALGIDEIPATVIPPEDFDEDKQKFQIVRNNIIRGKMSAEKFMNLYNSLSGEYSEEVAATMFGFTDEEEFRRLIAATKKELPPELKKEFSEAAKEIKTVEELASLLNRLFSQYGDSLPYGYMIVDFEGREAVWLRMKDGDRQNFFDLCGKVRAKSKTVDGVLRAMWKLFAAGEGAELLEKALSLAPEVDLSGLAEDSMPLEDYTDQL